MFTFAAMLKRGLALLLITCTLAANFTRLFVYAGYQLNQKYIASTLCENKSRPWMHCNGHCYLMKKVQQAEQKEKAAEQQAQKHLFQEAFFAGAENLTFKSQLLRVVTSPYQASSPQAVTMQLLRPPCVA